MSQSDVFEEKARAKKFWLLCFVSSMVLNYYRIIMEALMQIKFDKNTLPWNETMVSIVLVFILMPLGSFVVYRCAYAKPGTKLLKLLIGLGVVALTSMIFSAPASLIPSWLVIKDPIDWAIAGIYTTMNLSLIAVGLYADWKLHRANMRYKKSLKLAQATI